MTGVLNPLLDMFNRPVALMPFARAFQVAFRLAAIDLNQDWVFDADESEGDKETFDCAVAEVITEALLMLGFYEPEEVGDWLADLHDLIEEIGVEWEGDHE